MYQVRDILDYVILETPNERDVFNELALAGVKLPSYGAFYGEMYDLRKSPYDKAKAFHGEDTLFVEHS